MSREIIETGKTIEIAVKTACEKLGVSEEDVNIEILEKPKRILLGFKSTPAKVKVSVDMTKADYAKDFINSVIQAMGAEDAMLLSDETDFGMHITIQGNDLGFLIGKHGETLDAIQYITGLVVNQIDNDGYYRINVDCGNFREKREQSLIDLANKLASQVIKTGRNVTLEPMNPYERRIIHSTCQNIKDIASASVGVEPNRCVVISCTNPGIAKRRYNESRNNGSSAGNRRGPSRFNKGKKPSYGSYEKKKYDNSSRYSSPSTPYKKPVESGNVQNKAQSISDKDQAGALYGKIDLG